MRKILFLVVLLIAIVGTVSADYVLPVEALTNTPGDSVTNYFGNNPSAPTTTAGRNPVYIPVAGTISKVEIYDYSGTAGSNQAYSYYIRVNNANDYLINTLSVSTSERVFTNTSLNIAVNAGDYFEIKRVHPVWSTNPATNIVGGYVFVSTTTPGYVVWGQGLTNTPGDNALNYFGNKPGAPITTAGRAKIYVPANGTVTRVDAREYSGTAGTAETYGYRIRKNTDTPVFVQNQTLNTNLRVFTNSDLNVPVLITDYLEFTRVHPNWSTNPATNIVGATAFVDTSSSNTLAGYPINVQALSSSPTDAQTVYFGTLPKAPTTTAAISKVYIRQSGTIKNAEIYTYSGTAGTNQEWSLYLRKNNTEDFLIKTVGVAAAERRFNNNALNIPVTSGDYIEIKGVQPTWTTNPATTIYGGYVWVEYGVAADTTPPASITGLNNDTTDVTLINWSWVNPNDNDFNGTMIYQNDVFLKNVSKETTYENWSGLLPEGTQYTISTRTLDLTGNVNQTWVNKTETTFYSGNAPVDVIIHTGSTTITDRLVYATDPAFRSQIIAEEMHTALVNAMPSPKGDEPATIEYTDGYEQSIIIKKVDLVTDDAKVGYWVAATRNGEEVHTHSPIWVVNSPYEVEESESYNPRTNERTVTVREDSLEAAEQVLSEYVLSQPLGMAEGDDVLIVYPTADGYTNHAAANMSFATARAAAGSAVDSTSTASSSPALYTAATSCNPCFSDMRRTIFSFNTSSLTSSATVSSANLYVSIASEAHTLGSPTYGITGGTLASNTSLAAGDYDGFADVAYSDTYIAQGTGANKTWPLNTAGLANVSKTSFTVIYLRHSWDYPDNAFGGSWVANTVTRIGPYFVEDGTAGRRPRLEITYTPAAGGDTTPPASVTNLAHTHPSCTEINWTWTNPVDADFNRTVIYWDDVNFFHNLTNTTTFDLWYGLFGDTEYNFSAMTCDITGNCNSTAWVNQTETTTSCTVAPVANFTSNTTTACMYDEVMFNDTSTNTPTYWNWIFTGGWDSHYKNFTHAFDAVGFYNVSLESGNDAGSNTTLQIDYMTITDCSPVANFTSNVTDGNEPLNVGFNDTSTNTPTTWNWSFNNVTGNNTEIWWSTDQNPATVFGEGNYSIVLNASNSYGFNITPGVYWINVTEGTPPFGVTNLSSKMECNTIEWSWTNPPDADFSHTMIYWNDTFMYNISAPTHSDNWYNLSESTSYTISTHTVDTNGNVNLTWVNETEVTSVCPVAPVADFSADNVTICEYESVQFTDLSTHVPTNWDWYPWGNETKASDLADPLIPYDVAGLFSVRLYASNAVGNDWENKTNYINVTDCTPPDHIEKLAETDGCYGINWTWIDPTNPPTTDLDHVEIWQNGVFLHNVAAGVEMDNWTTLSNATWYNISTRTVDTSGNIDTDWVNKTAITDICVSPPAANFTANETSICLGETIQFNDTSTSTPVMWSWAFGVVGGHSNDQNPVYTYLTAGLFDVGLKIGTADGMHNETEKVDYINVTDCTVNATASFTSNVTCGIIPFAVQFIDTSTGGNITNWSWMFGDGNTSVGQNPVNNYTVVGMYTINFSVTNSVSTSWSNVTNYITARFPGDTCAGGTVSGDQYDTDKYPGNWFTSWLM